MGFEIVESSPKARGVEPKKRKDEKYPFDELEIGQSFTAPIDEINWKSLRVCVYQRNARSKDKEFTFVKHDDLGLCEVARIA